MDRKINEDEFYKFLEKKLNKYVPFISKLTKPFNKIIEKVLTKQFKNYKKLSETNDWGNTWKIELNPHNRKEGIAFDFLTCPIV